tara:strand:- start:163 stop:378 length:216 start_codon:yes stop_codon:yes gene_type:complete
MGTSKLKTANKVFARLSFSDMVMSRDELFATQDEVCSCDFMITGYEDENGNECDSDGVYPGQDPAQVDMFM